MSENYRSMWTDLGLDLDAHDALLGVLSNAYQEIFLSQKERPEGMAYFDFVMSEVHGLRIKELMDEKADGRKIVGSYCVFVPEELVLAANATLVGLCSGADFATEDVEKTPAAQYLRPDQIILRFKARQSLPLSGKRGHDCG